MKTAVWEWVLPVKDLAVITAPPGTEFIHAHEQGNDMCVWGIVNLDEERRQEYTFRIAGTGHVLTNGKFSYVGSAHLMRGALVFHVFECK